MRGFLILDFGSQYTQVIARRLRDLGFYSEICSPQISLDSMREKNPYGIILSGGPQSVYEKGAPYRDVKELLENWPILGICYGFQLLVHQLGGKVTSADNREYGRKKVEWKKSFAGISKSQLAWMSHGDVASEIPPGFELLAETEHHPACIKSDRALGVQFHPEVFHTEEGEKIFLEFSQMCKAEKTWTNYSMQEEIEQFVHRSVKSHEKVLCALSGGVDSTVVATLLHKILKPGQLQCVFVNTGLLREGEVNQVMTAYQSLGLPVRSVDVSQLFLEKLKNITDPEQKRKIIGSLFIDVFDQEVKKSGLHFDWLAQGTLYPDVIESVSFHGTSVTIKSHHNVGGLPEKMKLKVLEPVRMLFKDEVRRLGEALGLSHDFIHRHPFPGPGLAIRILGEVTPEKVLLLQKADRVFINYLKEKK
ncbi:MAG: glutamine-hydrolyzing GMP synthase, partial [Bdellovibrionales bacterium]